MVDAELRVIEKEIVTARDMILDWTCHEITLELNGATRNINCCEFYGCLSVVMTGPWSSRKRMVTYRMRPRVGWKDVSVLERTPQQRRLLHLCLFIFSPPPNIDTLNLSPPLNLETLNNMAKD